MTFLYKVLISFMVFFSSAACEPNDRNPSVNSEIAVVLERSSASKAELHIQHFAGDFDYACLQSHAQPELIAAATEDLAWIAEHELAATLPDTLIWSSSKDPFAPRTDDASPVFRLWSIDNRMTEKPHTMCTMQMPTSTADQEEVLKDIGYIHDYFSRKYGVTPPPAFELNLTSGGGSVFYEYNFQIGIADDPSIDFIYNASTNSKGVIHSLTARWNQPTG